MKRNCSILLFSGPSDNRLRKMSYCETLMLRKVVNFMQNRNLLRKIMSEAVNPETVGRLCNFRVAKVNCAISKTNFKSVRKVFPSD